ncbi:MAG: PAS domain S-box protein, partial [Chloroflexi bacterium]|nr:PAS domain S-box protein [Chloroflexota bacterium]
MPSQNKLIAIAIALYVLLFFVLYPVFDSSVIALSVVPVGIAGWFYGTRMGFIGTVGLLLLDTVLLNLVGREGFLIVFDVGGIPNLLALFFVAGLTGTIHQLQQQYRDELARRKDTERELQEREQLYRKLFNSNFEAIAIHRRGVMLDVNELFEKQFGANRSDIIGHDAIRFAAPESRDSILESIRSSNEEPFEATGLRADGTRFTMEMQTRLINYQGKRALFTALRDVTERKEAGESSLKLERMQLLRDVVGNISHDLRTPMTIISNYLYILQYNNDPQKRDKAIKQITEQTNHLNRLIESLISMSRLDEDTDLQLDLIDIDELVKMVINHFQISADDSRITLDFQGLDSPTFVTAAEPELYRAVTDLLENAIHHSPVGGVVMVKTRVIDDDFEVSITDQGPGIAEEHLPHIFERFYRIDSARSSKYGRG